MDNFYSEVFKILDLHSLVSKIIRRKYKNNKQKIMYLDVFHLMLIDFLNTHCDTSISSIASAYKSVFYYFEENIYEILRNRSLERMCPNFIDKVTINEQLSWQALFESYDQRQNAFYYFLLIEKDNIPFIRFFVDASAGCSDSDEPMTEEKIENLKQVLHKLAIIGHSNTQYRGTSAGWSLYRRFIDETNRPE